MGNCVSGGPSSSANATTAEELPVCNYHVFLSFRGPDVRRNFLDCFYDQLRGSGIVTFRDREEIKPGERINTKILEAIKRSDICVPVFSKNFASSAACLMEVALMVESGKPILPIFYGVKPSVVKYLKEEYGRAFIKHERRKDAETIRKWKNALEDIPENLGFEVEHVDSGYHDLLQDVVSRLRQLLRTDEQEVTENLVGIDRDVQEIMRKLGMDNQEEQVVQGQKTVDRCVVEIWGLPGVGKTTLAKKVYNKINHLFDSCSFLENVRDEIEQNGMVYLQKKLIQDLKRGDCPEVKSNSEGTKLIKFLFQTKRVLIVLDNVDDFKQIKPLAENLCWFGPGSRIILTSRKKEVTERCNNDQEIREHELLSMSENHALKLFYKHAFRSDHPPADYGSLPRDIVSAVGKLPFAIEVVGKYLYDKSKAIWGETLQKLEREPERKVEEVLTESYHLLEKPTKEIFLDIACFFIGVEKTIPYYMWNARDWPPNRGVLELQNMSFLKIGEGNKFLMDKQLKILGRAMVKNENLANPGLRSRVWDYEDVKTTLRQRQVTNNVEALRVTPNFNQDEPAINRFHCDDFCHLSNVRFLELDNVDIEGNPENLLPRLVWLDWHGCHEKSKLFALNMEKLVILGLGSSQVQLSLEDWRELMVKAKLLKVLNAKDCPLIIASLEFSDQALCSLQKLEELFIDGTKIKRLEFQDGSLPALKTLSACECEDLNDINSITFLKNLRKLTVRSCEKLKELPAVMGELVLLEEMDLSYTLIKELPPSVKVLEKLEVLKMIHTYLEGFPEAVRDLKKLKELAFTYCISMSGPCDISRLPSLRILRLKCTGISCVLAEDYGQFNILELDVGVDKQTVS
ncbi:hypothetical protein BT93_E2227 [Corymbia citriodora subsp. variegata]|nr:hypothetical protein BT93_E2227 [Corymbia citriodora subsp. variegata]